MISEEREVNTIFKELFSSHGNEIFLHPVTRYIKEGVEASFHEIQYIGKNRHHLVFGYRDRSTGDNQIFLNPEEPEKRRSWHADTEIISLHFHITQGSSEELKKRYSTVRMI